MTENELIDLALSCGPDQTELRQQALLEHSERTRGAVNTVVTDCSDMEAIANKLSRLRR